MEKIGVKTIETSFGKRIEFDVYPCNCKVGDTVWFDDGIPDEDGVITYHSYMYGKVTDIEPDEWRIFNDGEKELGFVTVKVEDDELYAGQNFLVAFKDIIYQQPTNPMNTLKSILEHAKFGDRFKMVNNDVAIFLWYNKETASGRFLCEKYGEFTCDRFNGYGDFIVDDRFYSYECNIIDIW